MPVDVLTNNTTDKLPMYQISMSTRETAWFVNFAFHVLSVVYDALQAMFSYEPWAVYEQKWFNPFIEEVLAPKVFYRQELLL